MPTKRMRTRGATSVAMPTGRLSTLGRTHRAVSLATLLIASPLAGCADELPGTASGAPAVVPRAGELPLVDTRPWLAPIPNPPGAWTAKISKRDDVLRHRFVQFEPPSSLPDPDSRFLIAPFPDAMLKLRVRRAGPTKGVGYSWFGMFEDDPRGFGGIVVRPNGRVFAEVQTPDGARFQVTNVGNQAYAILELEPEGDFECGVDGEKE